MKNETAACARCPVAGSERLCRKEDGRSPDFCPTKNCQAAVAGALEELKKPEILEFARQASIQEAEGYTDKDLGDDRVRPIKPRILETVEFARKMNYKRLGFVFCIGLAPEAKIVEKFLTAQGFDVVSALCKVGRVPKENIGIRDDQKINIGCFESMCNPIAQAYIMNQEQTEFNIVMGLCVGHDSLFLKYADAPCTVLAAKDRLLGHNPLAAVYTMATYYQALK